MERIQKSGYEAPDISLFVPSLTGQLDDRASNHVEIATQQAKWQPRWTILFSLSAGVLLWAGIGFLLRL